MYLYAEAAGLAGYLLFYLIEGLFVAGFVGVAIEACILGYFYLCLLSYARAQDVVIY